MSETYILLSKISLLLFFLHENKAIVTLIVITFYIDFFFECASYIPNIDHVGT